MGQIKDWTVFAALVEGHIIEYVIPQYGDTGAEPATVYTADDCIKQAQRYLARAGRQARVGEELLDMVKAAHWIQKAHDRIAAKRECPAPGPAALSACPDCGRTKARNADDAALGFCPKWWAIRDTAADNDCAAHARENGVEAVVSVLDTTEKHPKEFAAVAQVMRIPSIGHASADEIAATVIDALDKLGAFDHRAQVFTIGDATMAKVFKRAKLTNLYDLQAVLNAVETALIREDEEDAEIVKLTCEATIKALGGDPSAFVTDYGQTVFDLTLYAIQQAYKAEGGA